MNAISYSLILVVILIVFSTGSSLTDEEKVDLEEKVLGVVPKFEQSFNESFSLDVESSNLKESINYLIKGMLYSIQSGVYFAFALPEILPDAAVFIRTNFDLIIIAIILLVIAPILGPLMILLIGTGLFLWDKYKDRHPKESYWRSLND